LLTAQRTYFRANLAYLDSLRELHVSAAAIDGLLLSGGLKTGSGDEQPLERPRFATDVMPVIP